ncbi:unnamed protein product [Calypogeia fissa]
MSRLGYTDDLPRPCNTAIQVTVASIRAEEIHRAIQEHERTALASQQDETPGRLLMKCLGIDKWFTIYFLAQESGIQMALQRLSAYSSILEYLEGDDECELKRQSSLAKTMELALHKVKLEMDKAKQEADNPSIIPAPVLAPVPVPVRAPHAASLLPSSSTTPLFFSPVCSPKPIPSHISLSDSPSASEVLSPNRSVESVASSPALPFEINSLLPKTPSDDLRSSITDNPLLDLSWFTEDKLVDMNVEISLVDCSPVSEDTSTTEPTREEPYVPVLPP